ncbi:amidase domain-containing protein [Anaeromassilibacillus sp. Marseille-P3371]|uniref:amidase domain-containing protein n=1 Tax=Anaeromassilibacillus sp. Marseille-P3371 TaxID=1944639 RepID=UPI0009EC66D3|nr:amidase domain-containing protein [Clostridiales bacterium]
MSNAIFLATYRVRKGDFIAYDAGNDGDWGHCAFVTAIGSKTSSGYTDFKVAQHSSDYNEGSVVQITDGNI